MSTFLITLFAVAVLLLTAVPGFILQKKKIVSEKCMSDMSKVLLYACQPCLAIYTFESAEFSVDKLRQMGIFVLLAIAIHAIMLGGSVLVLRRRFSDAAYRVMCIGTTFTNCAFFGIPIIEALLPEAAADLVIFTTVYALVMNILGWTVGSTIISGDSKYTSLKKILVNPATIGTLSAFLIFVLPISLPTQLMSMIIIIGRMTTPISMFIMGMRLATANLKEIFGSFKPYLTSVVKLTLMPTIAFLMLLPLPLPTEVKQTFYIICASPSASIVLNFSELVGRGQKDAAATVLLSTMISILTLPMMLLLPFF